MDPTKILAITFTARAAGEMRTRLRGLGVPTVAARTIHAAALKQLLFFWPSVFGGRTPDLLTSKTGFLGEAINRAGLQGAININSRDTLRDIANEIEWAKVSQIGPTDYLTELDNRAAKPRVNAEQVAQVYTAYESIKRQELAMDFEDVLLLTTAMLEEEREVRERVQDQYRYFTVDEYQDISPLQQRLINAWLGNRQEICVVGDPAQTIYSFAGATSSFLTTFTSRFPDAEIIRLTSGYRSTPEITFAANSLLRSATTADAVQCHWTSSQGAGALEVAGPAVICGPWTAGQLEPGTTAVSPHPWTAGLLEAAFCLAAVISKKVKGCGHMPC
jgi:DNA helicase-2/ATP-dependent DNA helicase PcrA